MPFFSQESSFAEVWPTVRGHCRDVIERGRCAHGSKVAELEDALRAWTGARHVVGVNSGTDALVLLLRACGLAPGEEVVVPAFGSAATASAVLLARGRPRFADIEPAGYGLDPDAAAAAVTPRTRIIMPAHLSCRMADIAGIAAVARRHGLGLVEDSAHAVGMRWNGVHAGLLGRGGALSFFPTTTLGAIGDAGAVLTDDAEVAAAVAELRHQGRAGRTLEHVPGLSDLGVPIRADSRMDDLQAAVLLAKLTRLDADIARRAELAAAYTERLSGVPGIKRLPDPAVRRGGGSPVYHAYLVEVEDREALVGTLAAVGVGAETYHPTPPHLEPRFARLGHRRGEFPNAEAACAAAVALPLYPDLAMSAVERVCDAVAHFYTGRRAA
ncbi:aminotransferase DegT [Marinitenerispora sediminis]|uniref:Aminotransferase DegT n=1 Tax=Marinitenerispora sediminis TaxID=1931232 RepID=A0A368T7K3_9ACTN|nr:aminotransferase DegT [Marinitenerispora sediminis]RCV49105.1 aminotransferase DegT [Marinitenerispora sediminis]RCV57718.1 aminotransferase DegT [Marinitenerispora sediminis]